MRVLGGTGMMEKLICAVVIAALWLCSFGTLRSAVDSAKDVINAYKARIEQEEDCE
jgi:hypothetical protein